MTRKQGSGSSSVDNEWTNLSVDITEVVMGLLKQRGLSVTKFAKLINYPQSSLSDIVNEKRVDPSAPRKAGKQVRRWSFPLLILTCKALGVPLHEVIRAATTKETIPWLAMRLSRTPPCTMDRLELIVKALAPEGTDDWVVNMFFSAQMFDIAAHDYVQRYLDGKISDEEVYRTLVKIMEEEPPEGNLWTGVKRVLDPGKGGTFSSL